jgi:uncharacterized repeat protein (TIGR01451 family)
MARFLKWLAWPRFHLAGPGSMTNVRRGFVPAAIVFVTAIAGAPQTYAADPADLSVSAAWVGHGIPRAAVGETVTYRITLTNLGPGTATRVYLFALTPDQFNPVSLNCVDPVFCASPGGELAAGATVTATVVDVVCCFPKGESRTTSAGATVFSDTDPDLANNSSSVVTRIVGPHGFFFPG